MFLYIHTCFYVFILNPVSPVRPAPPGGSCTAPSPAATSWWSGRTSPRPRARSPSTRATGSKVRPPAEI
ncbi:hypothetical protein EYF80_068111 [Liparis tanakae]|uniref:Uncharacterized protein n=1 Tax=Liparis tanakae TaxID=230148 RepID=A0A4Z2DZB6_9TELE|nr:hypothetical protein EYF80_068111 [Liparis tanakae]